MMRSAMVLVLAVALAPLSVRADEAPDAVEAPAEAAPPAKKKPKKKIPPKRVSIGNDEEDETPDDPETTELPTPLFELSFGSSQLFVAERVETLARDLPFIIPTSAALFVFDWFLTDWLRATGIFNLPLGPEVVVNDDGTQTLSISPPSGSIGLTVVPIEWQFKGERSLELQLALLGGLTGGTWNPFPLAAARLYLVHGEGVGIYIGTAFAFRLDTLGLIYGVGYRF